MGFAVEMYFDERTEMALRDLRGVLTAAGVKPVLDEMGDRPHISLAVFSQIDPDDMLEELEEFAGRVEQMGITLSAIGAFATAEAVLFLTPAMSRELLEVHGEFHEMLAEMKWHAHAYYLPEKWVPHCTMAQNVEGEKMGMAFEVLRKAFRPISGKIVEMGLVRFRPVVSLGKFLLQGE